MKKLLFAFSLVCGGFLAASAQDTTSVDQQNQQYPTMQQDDQERERINSRDLPDAVKRSLEGQEFRGWLINAAYKTKGVSGENTQDQQNQNQDQNQTDTTGVSGQNETGAYGEEVYVVELKNGAQTKTVRFSKDGEKLDDPGMENDQN